MAGEARPPAVGWRSRPPRGGGSHVLGLHHRDYCNTVQMGPSCNRLGQLDWTTGGAGEGRRGGGFKGQVTDGDVLRQTTSEPAPWQSSRYDIIPLFMGEDALGLH